MNAEGPSPAARPGTPPLIYNLFPTLAGPAPGWVAHAAIIFRPLSDKPSCPRSTSKMRAGTEACAQAPLAARWKLIRNGKVISEAIGETFDADATLPGHYRVEAWLQVGKENLIWILSNPIYVRPALGK